MSHNKSFAPLSGNKLFKGIQSTKIKEDFPQSNFVNYNEGDIIFQSGDSSNCIYLILSGEIKIKIPITMGGPSIDRKGKNDFFGEKELLGKIPRRSSAVANTSCTIYMLQQKELQKLISKHSAIRENLLHVDNTESSGQLQDDNEIDDTNVDTIEEPPNDAAENQASGQIDDTDNSREIFSTSDVPGYADDNLAIEDSTENVISKDQEIETMNMEGDEKKIDSSEDILEETELADFSETADDFNDSPLIDLEEESSNDTLPVPGSIETEAIHEFESSKIEPIREVEKDNSQVNLLNQIDVSEKVQEEEIKNEIKASYKKILQAIHKINEVFELNKVLNSISDVIEESINVELIRIYLFDTDNNELYYSSLKEDKERRVKIGEGLTGWAAGKKEVVVLRNAAEDPRYNSEADDFAGKDYILLFPVVNENNELLSLLFLANSKGEFTEPDKEFLAELSVHMALAIEKGKQFDSLLKKSRLDYLTKASSFIVDEVKTPLLIIKHYAGFIKKKTDVQEVAQITDYISEQTDSVTNSVELLSDFITNKNSLVFKQQNLNETLDNILEMLAEYVETRNVKLFKNFEASVNVKIDQTALYHVFFQVAKNACDAMPDGGSIYLSTNGEKDFVNIEFKDTGIGISSIIKSRIFEPFFSFGKGQAAGLGLAVAEKVIKDHGGKIALGESTGEGTAIIIMLPVIMEKSGE